MPLTGLKKTNPLTTSPLAGLRRISPISTPLIDLGVGGTAVSTPAFISPKESAEKLLTQLKQPIKKPTFGFPWEKVPIIGKPIAKAVEFLRPKTMEEIAMQAIPITGMKIVGELSSGAIKKIASLVKPQEIFTILKKEIPQLADDVATKLSETLKGITKPKEVQPIVNKALEGIKRVQPTESEYMAQLHANAFKELKKEIPNATIDDYFKVKAKTSTFPPTTEDILNTKKLLKPQPLAQEAKITLYHGTEGSVGTKIDKEGLRYGDFLTTNKQEALDYAQMRAKQQGTKPIIKQFEFAKNEVKFNPSTNEWQYLGGTEKLTGKYPQTFYKEYNDYFGSNMTAKEIDAQTDVWDVAKAISGYNEVKAKQLLGQATQEAIPKELISKPAVNIERLNIPQEAKQRIIKASEEIKPQLEKIKGKILSNNEVIEAAQKSEILRRLPSKEATLKSEAALLKTRQHLAELAKEEKLTSEFIDTLKTVSAEATKRGRELQALGIEADPILGTIKTKLVKQLLDTGIETDKILKAAEGIDFNNAKQVAEFYRKFVKPTLPEIIDEYRYINMLSSPKTQIVNTFSNILQATFLRPATRLASGVIDNIAHILTGKEQEFYIKQVPAYYKGAFSAFGDALSEGLKVMKGQQQIYRPDVKNIPTGLKILRPFQVIPRLMEASDVFFRKIASAGEIEALMSKGVSEVEAISKAAKTAEELVFRKALDPLNKTGRGILLSKIDALTSAVYKLRNVPGIKWFIPFVQTPMNILKQGIEYSPLGITTLPKAINKIEQLGKTLVGTTIFAGAGWLALKDRTSWAVPTSQKERDAFYAAGMQPYSVKIGDTWVSYSRLGPIAYPMAMAAAIKFYTKDNPKAVGDTEFQKTTKILSGIAQFFSDQSYVQGIGDFVNLAQGDIAALTRAVSQIPSQLIPLSALQRWVANIIDPIYRKTEKKLSIEGIIENLESGIPILKERLPAYTTPSGEPSERQYPFLNPLIPISISEENPEWVDYLKTLQQVSRERILETKSKEELKQSAQDLYDKMKMLPKEEAKRQFDDLIQTNPDLAKEVSDLAGEIKLDYKESFLKSLGVENGQRAKYVVEELNKLSKEEKANYYQNLIDKKVITKKVNEQVLELLNLK